MRRLFLLIIFTAIFQSASARYTPKEYIDKFAPIAMMMMREYEIPASVMLGIAFLESGYGNSRNAILLKNHFGLVGKNSLRKRGKRHSAYKEFDNDTLSYEYFCKTIVSKKYYPKLKGNINYKLWLSKIYKNNYAKLKRLSIKRVSSIIKKYHLYRFDVL